MPRVKHGVNMFMETANTLDSEGWELGYDEWLAECANPDRALEEMCEAYENGKPEDRYLIQFEMRLLSGEH
jgi:hypothetical protein